MKLGENGLMNYQGTSPSRSSSLSELKAALDDSSNKNRNLMIAFFIFQLYVFITALSTTDLQLFLLQEQLTLPFIGIPVPLIYFIIFAPMILLAFYYNLLLNLHEHTKILQAWLAHSENDQQANFHLLHAFMFNTRAKYDRYPAGKFSPQPMSRSLSYWLLNVIIVGTISLFPLALFVFIGWKYASYQSYWITTIHTVCVLVCVFLHIIYWLPIQYRQFFTEKFNFRKIRFSLFKSCKFTIIYLIAALLILLFRSGALVATDIYPGKLSHLIAEYPKIAWLIPHVDISSQLRIDNPFNQSIENISIQQFENRCKTKQNLPRLYLKDRNLRLAQLSYNDLCTANFIGADLRGADIRDTTISGDLIGTNLAYSTLEHTVVLPGTDLSRAILNHAQISLSRLSGVNMTDISAKHAYFLGVQASGPQTRFTGATLNHAQFIRVELNQTSFRNSNLEGSSFSHSTLDGVDFRYIKEQDKSSKQDIPIKFSHTSIKDCRVQALTVVKHMQQFQYANCKIYDVVEVNNNKLINYKEKNKINNIIDDFSEDAFNKVAPEIVSPLAIISGVRSHRGSILDLRGYGLTTLPDEALLLKNIKQLILSDNKLDSEQVALIAKAFPNLEKLELDNNQISELPSEIKQLVHLTVLNISANQLTTLSPDIGKLTQLTGLDMSGNQFTQLPPEIGRLTKLTRLDMDHNQLTQLPPEIGQLTKLTKLDMSGNQLTQLPPEIGQLTRLTWLDLDHNQLTQLPPEIGQLTWLTWLDLDHNQLTQLPPEIGQLTKLTWLNFSSNQLTGLPPEISQLTQLTALGISGNQFTQLPPEISQLTQLTALGISGNQFTQLSPEIGQLTRLTQLNISDNQLTQLPPEIGQLTKLTDLYMKDNQLTQLPPEIGQLTQLTKLDISGNQLTQLPPEIGQLTQLIGLDMSGNQFTQLPPEIGQLTKLTWLNFSSNQLTGLPPEISQLTQLTALGISGNQFTQLSPEIGQLTRLTQLNISDNQLTQLPPEIGQLTQLTKLDMSGNQFTQLPPEIGQLTKLTWLNLRGNQLTGLPPEIGQLTQLTGLDISGNQLTQLPPEISRLPRLKVIH
ncbi:leucine-rich repeat domain-containing protein [Celerinatantimonas sp. YJH-8]|uniref:leucine-rich repeat domain-containing protein n=1 Tax=Celerinatantimonas sp. YJH-8 TaxID=3228714 RepID=UPI0038C94BE2